MQWNVDQTHASTHNASVEKYLNFQCGGRCWRWYCTWFIFALQTPAVLVSRHADPDQEVSLSLSREVTLAATTWRHDLIVRTSQTRHLYLLRHSCPHLEPGPWRVSLCNCVLMYVVLYWKLLTRNLHHPCVLAGMGSVTCIQVKTLMNWANIHFYWFLA